MWGIVGSTKKCEYFGIFDGVSQLASLESKIVLAAPRCQGAQRRSWWRLSQQDFLGSSELKEDEEFGAKT